VIREVIFRVLNKYCTIERSLSYPVAYILDEIPKTFLMTSKIHMPLRHYYL